MNCETCRCFTPGTHTLEDGEGCEGGEPKEGVYVFILGGSKLSHFWFLADVLGAELN